MSTIRERVRALGHAWERLEHKPAYWPFDALWRRVRRGMLGTAHDRHWRAHPAVATEDQLTFGQRAADVMRGMLATWTFLGVLAGAMASWAVTGGFGRDPFPYILLNLCLSTLAGVQGAVLLIAAKRADQIAAQVALHTLENTEAVKALLQQNTELTATVERLARELHAATARIEAKVDGLIAAPTRAVRARGR